MREDWQKNWFLDGKRAILGHTDEGLWMFCTPSGVDKRVDREKFDAHHAVLWTKQEFEGDIWLPEHGRMLGQVCERHGDADLAGIRHSSRVTGRG